MRKDALMTGAVLPVGADMLEKRHRMTTVNRYPRMSIPVTSGYRLSYKGYSEQYTATLPDRVYFNRGHDLEESTKLFEGTAK